jgi:uncharacterized membrane protein
MINLLFSGILLASGVSFNAEVRPIFKKRCQKCHKGITNYETAYGYKDKIYIKVSNNEMPPKYKLQLTEYERDTIKEWIEGGANE